VTAPLLERWRDWSVEEQRLFRDSLAQGIRDKRWNAWTPYPWQVPPAEIPTHGTWLMLGGRGTGKTDGCARYMAEHVAGPPCDPRVRGGHRMAIVAPTLGDAAESCVSGPSGLRAHDPTARLKGGTGGLHVAWPSGAEARLFGAYTPEDVERLRAGGNRCLVWLEEVAAMRHLGPALEHTALGLRVGPRPHYIGSTTPKPRKELRDLLADPTTITTRGKTSEATHLDPTVRDRLYAKHKGTRLERQELEGLVLDDVEGALWTWTMLERGRLKEVIRGEVARIVVAIDPAATNTAESDETGIVVVAVSDARRCPACGDLERGTGPHGFVLEDLSGKFSPDGWARLAVEAYDRWQADTIVAEVNNGGEMVGHVIRTVDPTVRYRPVTASRGKRTRAEPVAALYEQDKVHHVGEGLGTLEEQMTTWSPGADKDSPDRMDALVWGLTEAMLNRRRGHASVT
jgi:phage terminase large subunit-like protein